MTPRRTSTEGASRRRGARAETDARAPEARGETDAARGTSLRERLRRPSRRVVAAIVVVALLVLGALAWWWYAARSGDDEALVASGSLEAASYDVAPATAGVVAQVLVGEGDAARGTSLRERLRRPSRRVVAAIVVVALLVLGALAWWWYAARSGDDEALVASGSLEAASYDVAPATAGVVAQVLVGEGDTVQEGERLVLLDGRSFALQVTQAQQGVAAATAAVTSAQEAQRDSGGSAADVTAAQARLKQAQAAVNLAKVQQGYATVRAPHAGQVVTLTTNAGQTASPSRTVLTLIDPEDLSARVYVPETAIGRVAVGSVADITADNGASTPGTVSFVASQAQFTPNNVATQDQRTKLVYEVRLRIDPAAASSLKPGMPVDVTFR